MGWCRLLCGEAWSSGAAAGLRATQLLSVPAQWEISKGFTEGLASLWPVGDKETEGRRDLSKVLLWREQKPGHPWPGPVEPPQLSGCCRLISLSSTAWQCLHSLGIQLLHGPRGSVRVPGGIWNRSSGNAHRVKGEGTQVSKMGYLGSRGDTGTATAPLPHSQAATESLKYSLKYFSAWSSQARHKTLPACTGHPESSQGLLTATKHTKLGLTRSSLPSALVMQLLSPVQLAGES